MKLYICEAKHELDMAQRKSEYEDVDLHVMAVRSILIELNLKPEDIRTTDSILDYLCRKGHFATAKKTILEIEKQPNSRWSEKRIERVQEELEAACVPKYLAHSILANLIIRVRNTKQLCMFKTWNPHPDILAA